MTDQNPGRCMNCAVVGLGKIGIMHTAMVRNIPGARLAALVDRESRLGRHVQSMMGTPVPFFASIEEAVRHVPLQAALVCTPQFAHRAVAEICLESGLDVFVEKPLAHSLDDAEAMVDLLHRHDAIAAVGFMKAHEGLYQEVGRLLQENTLGELRRVEATCYLSQVFAPKQGWIYARKLSGGGMVINSTCHLLHALQDWFGPVQAVTACCRSIHSTEVEDEASIELECGTLPVHINTSWSRPGYETEASIIRIDGSAGKLEVDDSGLRLELCETLGRENPVGFWPRARFEQAAFNLSPGYGGEGYFREDADFVQACLERRPARVGWEEGLAVQRIIDAIYRSQGRRIELEQAIATAPSARSRVDDARPLATTGSQGRHEL
jgi:predicted dehydrogenase